MNGIAAASSFHGAGTTMLNMAEKIPAAIRITKPARDFLFGLIDVRILDHIPIRRRRYDQHG
jgi:hypothetical protein